MELLNTRGTAIEERHRAVQCRSLNKDNDLIEHHVSNKVYEDISRRRAFGQGGENEQV